MITLLAASIVQVSIVLGAALAAAAALRRLSAASRHWILAVAVAAALLATGLQSALAIAAPDASRWTFTVIDRGLLARLDAPAASDTDLQALARRSGARLAAAGAAAAHWMSSASNLAASVPRGVAAVSAAVWGLGALISLALLAVRLSRLRRLRLHLGRIDDPALVGLAAGLARSHGIRRPIALLDGGREAMVVTWGMRRPCVVLPSAAAGWPAERLRIALDHELAHIRRGDWPIQIAAALLQCWHWFNPIVWLAARTMRREAERACDDLVLASGVTGADYAAHLLAIARSGLERWPAAAAIARTSTLEGRVRAMLNTAVNRQPATRAWRAATVLAFALVTLAVLGADRTTLAQAGVGGVSGVVSSPGGATSAQAGLGGLSGVVYDPAGAFLPSVAVSITHAATGRSEQRTTDSRGSFAVNDVPAGTYELTLSLPGFATVRGAVDVHPGLVVPRRIVLPLGSIEETITIVGPGAPGVAAPAPRPPAARDLPEPGRTASAGTVGGNIRVPRKLHDARPLFPAELAGSAATVMLVGRIGIDGFLIDLKDISQTPAHPAFVASLTAAVRQWEFSPTYLNGSPVEANITITGRFVSR